MTDERDTGENPPEDAALKAAQDAKTQAGADAAAGWETHDGHRPGQGLGHTPPQDPIPAAPESEAPESEAPKSEAPESETSDIASARPQSEQEAEPEGGGDYDPFADLVPKPSQDDIYFMSDELRELTALIQRNDLVVVSGAPVIAWWGFCSALAGLWNFAAMLTTMPHIPMVVINAVVGYAGSALIIWRMGTARILKLEFQAITAAWMAVAFCMPIMITGLLFRHVETSQIYTGLQCLMFASATGVTAMASRKRLLLVPAFGWGLVGALMFFVVSDLWRPILFSASCLAFMTAPGLYLWLMSRKALS